MIYVINKLDYLGILIADIFYNLHITKQQHNDEVISNTYSMFYVLGTSLILIIPTHLTLTKNPVMKVSIFYAMFSFYT